MNKERKNILLICTQPWEGLFVSKHHYAIELTKNNFNVFFLCPESRKVNKSMKVNHKLLSEYPGLYLIEHNYFFPYQLKFHFRKLYDLLIPFHLKKILKSIDGDKLDIVWSFDLCNYYPFRLFDKNVIKIFHPVDESLAQDAIDSGENSDIILSVTNEILQKYIHLNVPSYLINHGLSEAFTKIKSVGVKINSSAVRIGFSGNLRRRDIDRNILLNIINENENLIFEFWGSYENENSCQLDSSKETDSFIALLKNKSNVVLHGMVKPEKLAEEYQRMDAFLICYDVQKDQSKGTNYHKIIEFLSTGKVVISSNISAYKENNGMIEMVQERTHNNSLPILFKKIISNLQEKNSSDLQKKRIEFAHQNTYSEQVEKIMKLINI